MNMRVAVQMDPMDGVNINGDSSFALMLSAQSPAFGLDPVTGEVVLHHRCELRSTTPPDLYQMIVRLCGIARDWRDTHFLP